MRKQVTIIFCDGKDDNGYACRWKTSTTVAYETRKKQGWRSDGEGGDFCPEHTPEGTPNAQP